MARPKFSDLFLNALEECEGRASNASLQARLGWEGDKYWKIHSSLFDAGIIEKGKGYSGTVILVPDSPREIAGFDILDVESDISAQSPVPVEEIILSEDELYAPAQEQLSRNWAVRQNLDSIHIENIAKQGRRDTGGSWSRPDLALVALKSFEYIPDRIFEIHTFEIKASYEVTVKGVMEALSHRESATRAFVIYHTAGRDMTDFPEASRIETLAVRHGVGVLAAKNINDFNEWAEIVPAKRNNPDPDEMETFIKRSLNDETKSKILKWRR